MICVKKEEISPLSFTEIVIMPLSIDKKIPSIQISDYWGKILMFLSDFS